MKIWIIASIVVAAITLSLVAITSLSTPTSSVVANKQSGTPAPLIPIEKIVSGGPPKDGIPSIDKPKFVTIEKATTFLR